MGAWGQLAIYCTLVVLASLAGGWLPSLLRLTHQRLQMMISVVSGLMLGVALFHLLPHAALHLQSLERAMVWTMVGLLAMFFLLRGFQGFHAHEHGWAEFTDENPAGHSAAPHAPCQHEHARPAGRGVSWMGVAAGLSLHTLIDGVALGAAVTADRDLGNTRWLAGLGTFLAVALHKPLDSLSITTIMVSQGWSARSRQFVNFGYALICPLGAALFVLGAGRSGHDPDSTIGAALAFAAGVFLCIALADLLPEVEYHSHDRFKLSAALLAGVALAYAVGLAEPHSHEPHSHETHSHETEHERSGHVHELEDEHESGGHSH